MAPAAGAAAAGRCLRCGAPLLPLATIARRLDRMVEDAVRAREELSYGDQGFPHSVPAALAGVAGFAPELVGHLRCHAGVCGAEVQPP